MFQALKIDSFTTVVAVGSVASAAFGLMYNLGYLHSIGPDLIGFLSYKDLISGLYVSVVIYAAFSSLLILFGNMSKETQFYLQSSSGMSNKSAISLGTLSSSSRKLLIIINHVLNRLTVYFTLLYTLGFIIYLVSPKRFVYEFQLPILGMAILISAIAYSLSTNRVWSIAVIVVIICQFCFLLGEARFFSDVEFHRSPVDIKTVISGRLNFVFLRHIGDYNLLFDPDSRRVILLNDRQDAYIAFNNKICPEPEWKRKLREIGAIDGSLPCGIDVKFF